MTSTTTPRTTTFANAFSMRVVATGLVVVCTALMGAMYNFELSIYQAAQVGCAKVSGIQDNPTEEPTTVIPVDPVSTTTTIANGSEPAIDFVPKHVIYPPSVFASSLAEPIALDDALHHATLHVACLKHTESIILWEFARNKNMSMANVINRDDPDLFNKIRQCPDVDIFHPGGLRGHGYCEDSVAYLKYLESRLLPQWVLEDEFTDPITQRKHRYHELCPRTPVIMFNHYWFHDRGGWPKTKKLYVMPNIEMGQLKAAEYWSVDAVLCKTAICARRVTKWFKQNGNPRNARVFYTRHSSADIATLAKSQTGETVIKDFSNVSFAHASGSSPFKGTDKVFDCWMSRTDLPPLKIVIDRGRYERAFKNRWDKQVQESNGRIQVHVDGMDANQYGTLLADTSFFLCPSTMEGYGHYLNQVRAAGALIITTDLAPMNEFLSPESAVIVPVTRRTDGGMILSGGFNGEHGLKEDEGGLIGDFSGDDLCHAVDRVSTISYTHGQVVWQTQSLQVLEQLTTNGKSLPSFLHTHTHSEHIHTPHSHTCLLPHTSHQLPPATMLTRFFALSSAVAVLLAASQVDAHGHLVEPKAEFGDNKAMMSSFAGRIPDPNTLYPGSNFPASGTKGNYQEFMKHFKNGTQSLKEIIDANNKPLTGATKECGFSVLGSPQAAPATMLWGKNEGKSSSEGFRPTHLGACETYCDDTLVQKNDECATAYNQPDNKGQAKVPIEVSKCVGAKQLTFYWLSTQAKDEGGFQVYVNCIALSGASSGGSSAGSSSTPSAGDADADAGDDNGDATLATVKPSSAAGDDTEGSGSGSDSVNVPTSKTPKTKKPKKTKQPKVKKTKKPKKEKSDKSSSSADSDADAGSLADDVDCN